MTSKFPKGWDASRVRSVIDHYEHLTEEEAVAEDEAAYEAPDQSFVEVPSVLLDQVRKLIAENEGRDV